MISSISFILSREAGIWMYVFAFVLGCIQFLASIHYKKLYKKVLILCFGVEIIYYVLAILHLFVYDVSWEVKLFGTLVGCGIGVFLVVSMISLIKKA